MFQILKLVGFIGLAVWLFFSYTKPTWVGIADIKKDIEDHQTSLADVERFEQKINTLQAKKDNLNQADLDRMDVLAPKSLDETGVMADVQVIVERNGARLLTVGVTEWTGGGAGAADAGAAGLRELSLQSKNISIAIEATYEQFKNILVDLERSLVLLEVVNVTFGAIEGDIVNYQLTIRINQII